MYQIRYKKAAVKYLRKMPVKKADQFLATFNQIARQDTEGLNIVPFQGVKDGYRLRLGDYRAIYTMIDAKLVIEVITIGSRGDVYK